MTQSFHPLPAPLSPSGRRRALAATMLGTATLVPPLTASLLVEVLDGLPWTLLALTGTTPAEARAILAAL